MPVIRLDVLAGELRLDPDDLAALLGRELAVAAPAPDTLLSERVATAARRLVEGGAQGGGPQAAPRLVRFDFPGRGPSLGLLRAATPDNEAVIADLTATDPAGGDSPLPWLRRLAREGQAAAAALAAAAATAPGAATLGELVASGALLPPIEAPEVWAAGVTYARSRDARDRETQVGQAGETPYDRVYVAARPELFLKATAARVRGAGAPLGLRGDSSWQVPEPELALVLDQDGSILGYTLGNDMSARDIEGENPLYLPQAKIFRNSCTLGPCVLAASGAPAGGFPLTCTITRAGQTVWTAETSTAAMRRTFAELVSYLLRHNWILPGSVLLTGTGVVPPDDLTLCPGDEVAIESPAIGVLRNVAALV